jgi:hypothetical protein
MVGHFKIVAKLEFNCSSRAKIQGVEQRKKGKRDSNPRMTTREDIKDEDLKRELKKGSVLNSYFSTDQT